MFHIEPLSQHHDRAAFRSGTPALDSWLRRAPVDGMHGTFVAVGDRGLAGFYTLGSLASVLEPEGEERPLALIARLARDRRLPGVKLGAVLLADALARVLDHAPQCFAIAADAPHEPARRFYGQFGFTCLPQRPERMLLLASTAAKARAHAP